VAGRKSTSFHGADGAGALQLQGIGQQWPPPFLLTNRIHYCFMAYPDSRFRIYTSFGNIDLTYKLSSPRF
jgi:hypothetical protein